MNLTQGLDFTPQDLSANQRGVLTDGQKRLLQQKLRREITVSGGFALGYLGIGLFWLVIGLRDDLAALSRLCAGSLLIGCVVAVFIFVRHIVGFWTQSRQDIQGGIVEFIQGSVILKVSGRGTKVSYMTYSLMVNNSEFKVPEKAWRNFKNLAYYRLYYAPNSRVILSAEEIENRA